MAKLTGLQKLQQAAANMAKYGKEAPTAVDIARGGPGRPVGYTPTSPTPPPPPTPPPSSLPMSGDKPVETYTQPSLPMSGDKPLTTGDDFQTYFATGRAKGIDANTIKQAWASSQLSSATPPPSEQTQMAEAFGDGAVSFKDGLSETQKQSIKNLLSSGKMFNETDAKNYAYSIGESNWQQFIGKNPGVGALSAPGEKPSDDTPEDPKTIVGYEELEPEEKSKADELYDKVIAAIDAYGADEYDPETKRLELIEEEGLDDDFQKINDLDGQIILLEQGRRDREEDLRAEMKAENATESQIQRELAGQLRPLDRRLRELYDEHNIISKSYNRAMDRINIRMGDIESNLDREARERKDELNLLLTGYGLEIDREEEAEEEDKEAPTTRTVDGNLYQWNSETQKWDLAIGKTGNVIVDSADISGKDFTGEAIVQPSDTELNKMLTGFPNNFKTYVKSIAGQLEFQLNRSSIGAMYKQIQEMGYPEERKPFLNENWITDTFTEEELKKFAKAAGFGKLLQGSKTEVKNWIKQVMREINLLRDEGKSDKEIEDILFPEEE